MSLTVESKTRPEGSKPNALRRSGLIPANLYGHKGRESISLVVDAKVVERLLKAAAVNKTEIELNIPELEWTGKTVLKEVQTHPAKGTVYHISFCATAKD
ncbi:50S ribosomal protein L25 [Nostoc sp. TCL26-01]|uniref:50S ribosomal protein L25 n=1 Tax=Nostoc sp. TCL26-01 TaxID=2576904 RepID=UPI0015BBDB7E|nr:50S ribosomal protein L25 [Nostoc sp. TCL26-01]QLE55393.1 50S ribosomal protein L25 [Nostoc sp. TCL26-01]